MSSWWETEGCIEGNCIVKVLIDGAVLEMSKILMIAMAREF